MLSIFKRLFHFRGNDELYELKCFTPFTPAFLPSNINIQIKKTRKGYYYWRLVNLEGKVLAVSKSWVKLPDCLRVAGEVSHKFVGEIISSY